MPSFTIDPPNQIQIRIWILGRTENAYVSVGNTPPSGVHLFRRPAIANTPAETSDDMHRRFLVQSTANVRNLTLGIYNFGDR